jgi:hypothetical protein
MMRPARSNLLLFVAVLASISCPAGAEFTVGVSFNDPAGAFTSHHGSIAATLAAAGERWGRHLGGSAHIDVRVEFDPTIATSTGRSATSGFVGTDGVTSFFEQGVAYELRTGIDLNGPEPDAFVTIGTGYLGSLWYETDLQNRTGNLPADRVDAYSVFLHEFGHILAFNGWLDAVTGAASTPYLSPFDAFVAPSGGGLAFIGPEAMSLHGGPVPLTAGNLYHLGNEPPGPGAELGSDLMTGLSFLAGRRYSLSDLDLAIASDVGLSVVRPVPEPGSVVLIALGIAGLATLRRRLTSAR